MANLHNQFLYFEKDISLSPAKKQKLIAAREALQNKIRIQIGSKGIFLIPKFYIQGSYKMGTMVLAKDGTYDVDLGIYFLDIHDFAPASLQGLVLDAVKNHTTGGVEHREKCIRVKYKGDFDIDLPVYRKNNWDWNPKLATKNGWQSSDPKELCDWFKNRRDKNGQLTRIVKYLKTWAHTRDRKMPSGIALSVWVAKNFIPMVRDDQAFYETIKAIKSSFFWEISCTNPAAPGDDLIAKLDFAQKKNFIDDLNILIHDAKTALEHYDTAQSSRIWRQQLGRLFPLINN